jgi:REP element-mobilizing transposase RayT
LQILFVPNTYTQLHIHFVFAVKYRKAIITNEWEDRLHKYITGIVQGNGHKMLAINSAEDHIHIFIGLNYSASSKKSNIGFTTVYIFTIVFTKFLFSNSVSDNFFLTIKLLSFKYSIAGLSIS